MSDKIFGVVWSILKNGLYAFVVGWVVSIVSGIVLAILGIPLSIILPNVIYHSVFGIVGFFLSYGVIFSLVFISGMLEDYGAPSLRLQAHAKKRLKLR